MHWYVLVIVIDFINIKKNWNLSKKFTMVESLGSSFEKNISVLHLSCKWYHVTTGIFLFEVGTFEGKWYFLQDDPLSPDSLLKQCFLPLVSCTHAFCRLEQMPQVRMPLVSISLLLWHMLVLKCADFIVCLHASWCPWGISKKR